MTSLAMVPVAWFAEVSLGNPTANHGVHAFSDRAHAKTGDQFGKIRMANRLSWRFPDEKAALTPKPATFDRLGEIRSGTHLLWRSRNNARWIGETIWDGLCRRRLRSGSDAATEEGRPERHGADGEIPAAIGGPCNRRFH